MAKTDSIHWSGGAVYDLANGTTTEYLPGYPCCCSGDKAREIAARGQQTEDVATVTCGKCLSVMHRAGIVGDGPLAPEVAKVTLRLEPEQARALRRLGKDTLGGVSGLVGEWLEEHTRRPAARLQVCCQNCSASVAIEIGSLPALLAELHDPRERLMHWARPGGQTLCQSCAEQRQEAEAEVNGRRRP